MSIRILFPLETAPIKPPFLTLKACVPLRVNSLCLLFYHKIRKRLQQEEGEPALGWVPIKLPGFFHAGRNVSKGLEN